MKRPWGVHAISDMWDPTLSGVGDDGRRGLAVAMRYPHTIRTRLRATWWVLIGRAEAVVWPELGDLEKTLEPRHD